MHISTQIKSFNYHGAKFSYLPWLLPLLDVPRKHFVDVFGGSAVVLLNMAPSEIETYNDINTKVVNFFDVLMKNGDQLLHLLDLTMHSRKIYVDAWDMESDTDLEKARKFFIRTQQSMWAAGAQEKLKGWSASLTDSRCNISEKTRKWLGGIENLPEVIQRFKSVQVECKDFRFIMQKYDSPEALLYLDSPYEHSLRSSTKYTFDFKNQDFFDMHYYAKNAKGKIAISGYGTPFMKELFKQLNFHAGPHRKNNRSTVEAYECLWTNY